MCALVKVRSKEDPFVSDTRIEAAVFRETDAKPGSELPVWRRHPQTNEITSAMLRWGLIPHWMKARPEITPINARAETVADKRMFADAYVKRRCIVPMDAFYERDKRKKLHAFAMTRRQAVRRRRPVGELAQSRWRVGADVRHHHRRRQRTGRNGPRPHAGDHSGRTARALARRRARPARFVAAVSRRAHDNDPFAALKIEEVWWAWRFAPLPAQAC